MRGVGGGEGAMLSRIDGVLMGTPALRVGADVTILAGELSGVTVHVEEGDHAERDLYYHLHEVTPRVSNASEESNG